MVKKAAAEKKPADKKSADKKGAKGGGDSAEKPATKVEHADLFV
jgi:hypothetical protein